jgi:hypothetical protein
MRIRLLCPNPRCARHVDLDGSAIAAACSCPHCRQTLEVSIPGAVRDGLLTRCPCCEGEELYVRKDFPRRLGLALVVLVAAMSFWLFGRGQLGWALGVLVALVLADLLIYRLVPTITVCYRCQAEFRGICPNPSHAGFDLATAEKFRYSAQRSGDKAQP